MTSETDPKTIRGANKAPFPASVSPMLATLTDAPFNNPDWIFEPKLDGYRSIAMLRERRTRLCSRRGLDTTGEYPNVAGELGNLRAGDMVLDGEIVALDEQGRPSFARLQQRQRLYEEARLQQALVEVPIIFYVFDILYLDGYDLRSVTLQERKPVLERVVRGSAHIRLVDHYREDGEAVYRAAVGHGFEGVVAKRLDSLYETGRRSRNWLKIKSTLSDDFIVGGYSRGTGGRVHTFGALLLGRYDSEGRLVYVGHVGTGFDEDMLRELKNRLDSIRTDEHPFSTYPPVNAPATWVRPELVAEIRFNSWTEGGYLRAPSFMRLREDKPPLQASGVEVAPPPVRAGPVAGARDAYRGIVGDVLEQVQREGETTVLKVQGHSIPVNNMGKVLWPAERGPRPLTKRDLLIYLARVSPYLLPHLRDRPLTLSRFPNGISGEQFFQKHWPDSLPAFVDTVDLYSEHKDTFQQYLMCNNLATLLWLGQIADLELHTWFSRTNPEPDIVEGLDRSPNEIVDYPDFIIFDIDPYIYSGKEAGGAEPELNRDAFARTVQVARWLREVLDAFSLPAFIKTSGKTGLHIHVPVIRKLDFGAVRSIAGTIGRFLMRDHPREITMEWAVEKRRGKVFFDHNQNSRGKTLASIYSPRPAPDATVSMAVEWEELDRIYPTDFTILNAPQRLEKKGDLWSGILEAKKDIAALLEAKLPG